MVSQNEKKKSVRGYEGIYEVSIYGNIFSLKRRDRMGRRIEGKQLSPSILSMGYPGVTLCNNGKEKKALVHRLVAEAFLENPDELPQVNHKDGNKENNHLENLEWVSSKQNIAHSIEMGLKVTAVGERASKAKLTESDVIKIRELLKNSDLSLRAIARNYNVHHKTIANIRDNKNWTHI
jgi:hypothetical protein